MSAKRNPLDQEFLLNELKRLSAEGYNQREIGLMLGYSRNNISRLLSEDREARIRESMRNMAKACPTPHTCLKAGKCLGYCRAGRGTLDGIVMPSRGIP